MLQGMEVKLVIVVEELMTGSSHPHFNTRTTDLILHILGFNIKCFEKVSTAKRKSKNWHNIKSLIIFTVEFEVIVFEYSY